MGEKTGPPTKLVPYTDARGKRQWVRVEAATAAALDLYDRWAREREALWKRTHVTKTDLDEQKRSLPKKHWPKAGVRLVGYLNYELEPAANATGLRRAAAGEFEGRRHKFTWLIGESPTWDGPAARVMVTTVVERDEGKTVETTEYGIEAVSPAHCKRCRGAGRLPGHAVCLDCCRSGRDGEIYSGG